MKSSTKDLWWLGVAVLFTVTFTFMTMSAWAGDDRPGIPNTPRTGENIPSTTADALSASSSSATANPTLTANSGGGASNANLYESTDSLGLAFGNEAPIPYGATPECYVPGKGLKRAQGWVFGLVQLSAVLERDATCIDDLRAARAHAETMARLRLESINAEAAASRAATEAYKASSQRALSECGWEEICAASK